MFVFSCTELDKYLITSSYQVSLPLVNCFAVSSTRITQWPTWLTLLWHGPLRSQPMKWWLICFSLGWLSFKSLSKRHRHTRTHLPPSTTKSKQGLSGCSELCLMQQDERCCHVVKSRSMWWRQVFLSNNKSRTQEKLERIKEGMKKERTKERKVIKQSDCHEVGTEKRPDVSLLVMQRGRSLQQFLQQEMPQCLNPGLNLGVH